MLACGSRPPKPGRQMHMPSLEVDILAERPGVIVVLKKPGITTEATLEALQVRLGEAARVISVSRLDRDTSGVLVAATSQAGADCLTDQFRDRKVKKQYIALCTGRVEPSHGEINARLYISGFSEKYRAYVSPKGKEAQTCYEVLRRFTCPCAPGTCAAASTARCNQMDDFGGPTAKQAVENGGCSKGEELETVLRYYKQTHHLAGRCAISGHFPESQGGLEKCDLETSDVSGVKEDCFSLVACYPVTGRTHQIRAHLEWRGHPLVADANYNPRGQVRRHFLWCRRLFLHCRRMRLLDLDGQVLELEAPLPGDLRTALEACGLQPDAGEDLGSLDSWRRMT